MSLKDKVNSILTRDEIERLKFPVAWSATMPADEGHQQEAELHDMANDALDQLQAFYDICETDDTEYGVRFVDGEVDEIVEV